MGRGGRTQSALALTSIATPPDSPWMVAFRTFEKSAFHSPGEAGCGFTPTFSSPRFVVVEHFDARPTQTASLTHSFLYYETPDALLEALVTSVRLPKLHTKYVFEYLPSEVSFNHITFNDGGMLLDYTPPDVKASKHRGKRARSIVESNRAKIVFDYKQVKRFLLLRKIKSGPFVSEARSLEVAAQLLSYTTISSFTFLNFYDLDVSDQPIPIRIGLSYPDENGETYTFVEPA